LPPDLTDHGRRLAAREEGARLIAIVEAVQRTLR
jgi:hypothetical protein